VSEKAAGEPIEKLEPAALPAGFRIYAIGDIHGRFDLLEEMTAAIRRDLDSSPPNRGTEIFLGDYIDRGPQSRDVLDWLIEAPSLTDRRICLMGNHEAMLLAALQDVESMPHWLYNGAPETLSSYGVRSVGSPNVAAMVALRENFIGAFPPEHMAFVKGLPRTAEFGRYLFVHAGIRPGVAVTDQDPEDLVWIREPFLPSDADFGRIVVHGHTPVQRPDVRANRINIDTGAFFTGRLTCLVLEGDARRFLVAEHG
jgi:serine/threonine protein phosphatase 1